MDEVIWRNPTVRDKQWKAQLWPSVNYINFLLYCTKSKATLIRRQCGTKSCVNTQPNLPLWSKSTVNAAVERDPTERQGSSIRKASRRTLVTVCDKFQLVRCSQSVVSYGSEKACFKVCRKSWITNNTLTWNFVSDCKKVLNKHTKY